MRPPSSGAIAPPWPGVDDPADAAPAERVVERHSVRRNASVLMISQMVTWCLALVMATIVARKLGPAAAGQFRLAGSLWGVATVFISFGTGTYLTVELARNGPTRAVNRVVGLQSVLTLISIAVMVAFVAIAGYPSDTNVIIAIFGVGIIATLPGLIARSAFFGMERMTTPSIVDIAGRILLTATTVAVLLAGLGVTAVAVVGSLCAGVAAAATVVALRRSTGIRLKPEFSGLKTIAKVGVPFLIIEATLVLYQQVDTIMMSFLVDEKELGWYAVASTLFGTLLFIPTVLLTAAFPMLARLSSTDHDQLVDMTRRTMRFLIFAGMPLGLGTIALAGPICLLLYGDAYSSAAPVLAVYGVLTILIFPVILLGQHAIVTGHQRQWAAFMMVGIALTIPLDLLLVPFCEHHFNNGAIGGALSYLVTELFTLVAASLTIVRYLYDRSILQRTLRCLLSGAVMLVVVWPVREMFILIPVVVGAIAYFLAIVATRTLDHQEWDLIGDLRHSVLRRFSRGRHAQQQP